MLAIVFIMFLINFGCESCSFIKIKPHPEYKGVDPRVQPIVNEFKELAKIQGITFNDEVTIGFKRINSGDTIGICTQGLGFHEIDIDEDWWNMSTKISHMSLLYHELSHCYCEREHDWGTGTAYPEIAKERFEEVIDSLRKGETPPGRYEDGCPLSILYPIVLDNQCFIGHYSDYVIEMFNRCTAW